MAPPVYTAKKADRHALYQLAVQSPEVDVAFIDRVFLKERGRRPVTLREDFCGTALLSATWVQSRAGREAFGVDLDPEVLAWGRKHNIAPLGEDAARVHLQRANVITPKAPKVDVQVAFNFSYWIFERRPDLLKYFKGVRASIKRDGIFFLDIHGGWESSKEVQERKRLRGFRYIWDQASFNPVDHHLVCHIHFEFPDGTRMRKAFSYEWRWWSMMEIRDLLEEAGFRRSDVYWEGTESGTKRGNGVFRKVVRGDNDPSYIAYIVAFP